MSCTYLNGGDVVVCAPPRGIVRRKVAACPTCKRRTRQVVRWGGAWYGSSVTCCACGDGWEDGERLPRPFARGWRQRATAKAREAWATALTPERYHALVQADVAAAIGEPVVTVELSGSAGSGLSGGTPR